MWAATGRAGGVSRPPYDSLNLADYVGDAHDDVATNRARLAGQVGARGDSYAVMAAVHGAEVAVVSRAGTVPGVDALLTQEPGLAIVALGADCVPLALVGDDGGTVAVAHCGWRGLVADVVGVVVSAMRDHGAAVGAVVLGPAVCGRCYPVPRDRADQVAGRCSPAVAAAALTTCLDGQPGIDVRHGVRARLAELGIDEAVIRTAGGCTVEDPNLFSYRRDGATGRQGVVACLVPGASGPVARMVS